MINTNLKYNGFQIPLEKLNRLRIVVRHTRSAIVYDLKPIRLLFRLEGLNALKVLLLIFLLLFRT